MTDTNILLVDDDRLILATLSDGLRRFGYALETASDGERALALCAACEPDLAILDLSMPGMSGVDLARRLRETRRARARSSRPAATHLEAQRAWGETDGDRLDRAFAALEAAGIIARQNFTCCQTCGHAEIGGCIDEAEGVPVTGYAFYHQQDTESAAAGNGLFLAYGLVGQGSDEDAAAGQGLVVIEAMKMENELRTPRPGRVREIAVREGHAVETGALLAVVT